VSRSVGQVAEQKAARFLEGLGYRILHRNYTTRLGEIDIVAEDAGGVLTFVEVRHRRRTRYGVPEETITYEKKRRLWVTARHYLVTHGAEARECRFDVVTIVGDEEPRLQIDAFRREFGG